MAASLVQNFVRFLREDYFMSEEFFGALIPIIVFWVYAGALHMMISRDYLESYRLHPKGSYEIKNSVSVSQTLKSTLVHQTVQTAIVVITFAISGGGGAASTSDAPPPPPLSQPFALLVAAKQFVVALLIIDAYQYFTHWYLHYNKFLYRHIHSIHHRIVVTHVFAAQYGHPVWDGLIDTIGSGIAFFLSGMSHRTAIIFFSLSVMRGIHIHCGFWLTGKAFRLPFLMNSAFHDFHHQHGGGKYNFSQPFFTVWDTIMGTYMPVTVEKRAEGPGFVIKTAKDI